MKKIYISMLGLFIAIASVSTISYAWLALTRINIIENLSLTAASDHRLEMSLDGIDYYESIPSEVVLKQVSNIKFLDVTSFDGINFYKNYSEMKDAEANKDYLSLEFHFRTTSKYTEIHLSDNILEVLDYDNSPEYGTYITSKGVMWESPITFLYDKDEYINEGEIRKYYAKDAMRVAFVDKNSDARLVNILDLSGNPDRGFGKTYGSVDFLNKIKNENNIPPAAPNTYYELSEFSLRDPIATSFNSRIITLELSEDVNGYNQRYYKGSVVMNVWLEGWDADSFDAIYKDRIKMQFMFRAVLPEGTLDD